MAHFTFYVSVDLEIRIWFVLVKTDLTSAR